MDAIYFRPWLAIERFVDELFLCLGIYHNPGCCGEIFRGILLGILMAPLFIIPGILMLLNLPIFLYNLFINLAIEPIVTFVRENLLGYSPMVHIRDLPEQAQ